jgi:hypothetical protein
MSKDRAIAVGAEVRENPRGDPERVQVALQPKRATSNGRSRFLKIFADTRDGSRTPQPRAR